MTTSRPPLESRKLLADELGRLRLHAMAGASVLERDGSCILGFGRARVFPLPNGLRDPVALAAVRDELCALSGSRAAPDELPLVIAALPFLPDRPGELVLPELSVVSDGASVTAVTCGPTDLLDTLLARSPAADTVRPPDHFVLSSPCPHEEFLDLVAAAVGEIRAGHFEKVVLARDVLIEANRPFRQADLLERLRALHPSCTTFAVDGFLGASPELLCRRVGTSVFSDPLAGTAPRSGDPEADRRIEAALLSSDKERGEHQAVVAAIAEGLGPVAATLEVPETPEIVELRNVSHLRTRIRAELAVSDGSRTPSVLDLVAMIHPTPAVAGSPVDVALEYLAKCEGLDRDRYAGPVGWMRADGDGEFVLGIRSAIVAGSSARLMAGVGIVADSDPEAELRETQLKLQAVLAAAVRP